MTFVERQMRRVKNNYPISVVTGRLAPGRREPDHTANRSAENRGQVRFALVGSAVGNAHVDRQLGAGDEPRLVGGQPGDGVGDILGLGVTFG